MCAALRMANGIKAMHHIPLFYNDEHAECMLSRGPNYINIWVHPPESGVNYTGKTAHIVGTAHASRELADKLKMTHKHGIAAYRIVVRRKRRVCIEDELKPYDMWRMKNDNELENIRDA